MGSSRQWLDLSAEAWSLLILNLGYVCFVESRIYTRMQLISDLYDRLGSMLLVKRVACNSQT